jgi:hypothetical protein
VWPRSPTKERPQAQMRLQQPNLFVSHRFEGGDIDGGVSDAWCDAGSKDKVYEKNSVHDEWDLI